MVVMGSLLLAGCGGSGEESAMPEKTEAKANNPLASQQKLLQDARDVQALIDEAEKAKEKARNSKLEEN